MNNLVSLIVPTYNERDNIAPLIERVDKALCGYKYEIVFVDDNSKDGTAEAVEKLSSRYPVRVIVRKNERGLATAVVHGFQYASGDIIGVMDADLQHPPEIIPDLVKAINSGADIVVASRYVKGGGCPTWGFTRKVISRGATMIARILLPPVRKINDPMSGFFMFNKQGIANSNLRPVGYKILLEVLAEGDFHHPVEVPYVFRERVQGQSKLNTRQEMDYLKHVFSLMKRTGEIKRFIKFCVVGLSGVLVNLGLYWILSRYTVLSSQNQIAYAISVESSIVSNFTLNDYWTFTDRRAGQGQSFPRRLGKFNLVSLGGWALNQGIFTLFNRVFGLYDILSSIIGIAIAVLWNYFVNRMWTWK